MALKSPAIVSCYGVDLPKNVHVALNSAVIFVSYYDTEISICLPRKVIAPIAPDVALCPSEAHGPASRWNAAMSATCWNLVSVAYSVGCNRACVGNAV
jgi:hypothetical protein